LAEMAFFKRFVKPPARFEDVVVNFKIGNWFTESNLFDASSYEAVPFSFEQQMDPQRTIFMLKAPGHQVDSRVSVIWLLVSPRVHKQQLLEIARGAKDQSGARIEAIKTPEVAK